MPRHTVRTVDYVAPLKGNVHIQTADGYQGLLRKYPLPSGRYAFLPGAQYRSDGAVAVTLVRVDISEYPDEGRRKMPKPQIASAQLLKPGEHPQVALHLANKAPHQMTLPVQVRVVQDYYLPVGTPRYHRRHPQLRNALPQPPGIVSLVRNHIPAGVASQQGFGLGNVVPGLPSG